MKSVKVAIFSALKASVALNSIVGVDTSGIKQIFSAYPASTAVYPCVGFYRIVGLIEPADGKLSSGNINELYSVDCMAKTMTLTEDMELVINEAMDTLDWIVTAENGPDLYDETTRIFHKVLRYRIKS